MSGSSPPGIQRSTTRWCGRRSPARSVSRGWRRTAPCPGLRLPGSDSLKTRHDPVPPYHGADLSQEDLRGATGSRSFTWRGSSERPEGHCLRQRRSPGHARVGALCRMRRPARRRGHYHGRARRPLGAPGLRAIEQESCGERTLPLSYWRLMTSRNRASRGPTRWKRRTASEPILPLALQVDQVLAETPSSAAAWRRSGGGAAAPGRSPRTALRRPITAPRQRGLRPP